VDFDVSTTVNTAGKSATAMNAINPPAIITSTKVNPLFARRNKRHSPMV
jgi:hypothetical protein